MRWGKSRPEPMTLPIVVEDRLTKMMRAVVEPKIAEAQAKFEALLGVDLLDALGGRVGADGKYQFTYNGWRYYLRLIDGGGVAALIRLNVVLFTDTSRTDISTPEELLEALYRQAGWPQPGLAEV